MLKQLTYGTLGDLDGGAAKAIIDAAIRQAVADLDDRGEDGKPRTVVIQLSLARMERDQSTIVAHVEAECKVPRRRTGSTVGRVRFDQGKPGLVFNDLAEDNPDQMTIDEVTN